VESISRPLEDSVYTGFENRFRGREVEIRAQQENFLAYFQPGKPVLDLGCGRGEFLELLKERDIEAEGLDLNEQMIAVCREKGLNCRKADILEGLSEYEDGSLGGIFSSQVVEHLTPVQLKRLVELAYFKLAPDSRLVLETLNPTSVFSLVQVYFLDLSHQQPIHPRALQFLLESAGFADVTISYSSPLEAEKLQALPTTDETTEILNQNLDKLNQLLFAPVNFAAIGTK
jgi:O-antigen chain-terminating methyltransferase